MFEQRIFQSRDPACKQPYGAVPARGPRCAFRSIRRREVFLRGVTLYIGADGDQPTAIPMQWDGLAGACDRYTACFTPAEPGLYWYYFQADSRTERQYICRGTGGVGYESAAPENFYQLTVYDGAYQVAGWFGRGITYNIFPTASAAPRCRPRRATARPRVVHEDWNDIPVYQPDAHGEILNNDFLAAASRACCPSSTICNPCTCRPSTLTPSSRPTPTTAMTPATIRPSTP